MTISIKNETIFFEFVMRQHWYREDIREVKNLHKIENAFCLCFRDKDHFCTKWNACNLKTIDLNKKKVLSLELICLSSEIINVSMRVWSFQRGNQKS
jgi:hypothetical protein